MCIIFNNYATLRICHHRLSMMQLVCLCCFLERPSLPSDSFVDFDDVLNVGSGSIDVPSNRNHSQRALQCITDVVDCCGSDLESGTVRTKRGDWYYPNGSRVEFGGGTRFLANRGPNEVINGQQFYGSVRLFRRFSGITERGRFFCELPNATDPSFN